MAVASTAARRRFVLGLGAAAIALLAAGCAPAPERPADEGERIEFRTARSPYAAAICIARNARARAATSAEERSVGASSSTEVRVRSSRGEILAIARVDDDGVFSRASVLVTPAVRADRAGFARQLMSGC